ncbi:MJ0042 family finger-like protein [Agrobacterium phage Atu_ph04]|uniref:MJ0042 family finger-like protein n=1 Tax=Agrobacterium phage Atu_ph04 TaxID=2024263 RepID=A0A223VZT0_9CAUD|nr:head scaffolding protein [Agrobacterium phage Atu_ph04]ASV44634.1 MJ0042 family finger-like protein [Agrobacterium phage Atu_ph04]
MGKKLTISKLVRLVEDEDIEKKMETEENGEKKDEVSAQTVDDDQTFVGETDEEKKDESEDDSEKKDESEDDGEKKDESEAEEKNEDEDDLLMLSGDEEKLEESDDDGEKKDESEEEEKNEEEEDAKVESLLEKLNVPKEQFAECSAILKEMVKTEATRLAGKAEKKIAGELKVENTKKIGKLRERLVQYAERSAEKFVESNSEKFAALSELEAYRNLFKKVSEAFVDLKFDTDPDMKAKVESLNKDIAERNRTIDAQNEKIEGLKLTVEAYKVSRAIDTFSEGLTATDKERFVRVVEGLEVTTYADFMKKAANIKKTIFAEGNKEEDGYKSFVEGLKEDVREEAPNLGIKKVEESSTPASAPSLAAIAAAIISGKR